MAHLPDFRTTAKAPDPAQVAALFQRKAEAENQARLQKEQQKRDSFKSILEAVQTGQQIAANALNLAGAKKQAAAEDRLVDALSPTASAAGLPADFPVKPTQPQEFRQAVARVDLKGFAKQALQPAGGRGGVAQKVNLLFPDGSTKLGFFDPKQQGFFVKNERGENVPAPAGTKQAFSEGSRFQFFTDADTGQRFKIDLVTNETVELKNPKDRQVRGVEDLTLKENDLLDKNIKRFENDRIRVAAETSLSQLGNIRRILDTDVGSATEPLKSLIIRVIAGEKGVLTDKDVARASGNQAVIPRLTQLAKKWKDGKMTPQNRAELRTILDTIDKNSSKRLASREATFTRSIAKRFRLHEDEVKTSLLQPTAQALLTPEQTTKKTTTESIQAMTPEQRKARIAELQRRK